MASSRRSRRRKQAVRRHRMRLEALEKRYALNAAPVLDPAASPQLNSILEDAGVPIGPVGTLVSDLIDAGGPLNNFSDADGDLPGIAITGVNLQGGALWYSSDDGTTWLDVGAVSDAAPRLLAADTNTRIYFEPAADFSGTISDVIAFRAWDRNSIWQQLGADIDGKAFGDHFGEHLSLSADGQTVAVGAFASDGRGAETGSVGVYRWSDTTWDQLGTDIIGESAGDQMGYDLAISGDGNTVVIGAHFNDGNGSNSGHVRVYSWTGTEWQKIGIDIDGEASGDLFGNDVAISSDGTIIAVGAKQNDGNGTNSGHVRVYSWSGAGWNQLGADVEGETAGDLFGTNVSLSDDGLTLAVAAAGHDGNGTDSGNVRIFRWNGSEWSQVGSAIEGEAALDEAWAAQLSADGNTVAVSSTKNDGNGTDSGHVRVYLWDGAAWSQLGADIDGEAAGDRSGADVKLSADGRIVAIGAYKNDGNGTDSGHIRVYEWTGAAWTQIGNDINGEYGAESQTGPYGDMFGRGTSLSADGRILAGGAGANDGRALDAGHVRVFKATPEPFSLSTVTDTISIAVAPQNDNPVLDDSASPTLGTIVEDAAAPVGPVGTLVSDLIDAGGSLNNFSDADGDLPGIAITGVNLQGGALWYSSDDGTTWLDVGAVSDAAPRLLAADATTRIYFAPAADFSGMISDVISFKAWDRNVIWQQLGLDIDGEAAGDTSGYSISFSDSGKTLAVGAVLNDGNGSNSGHVRIYGWTGSTWNQLGNDIDGESAGDNSATSVSLSPDGLTVAVGARYNNGQTGHVRIFRWAEAEWHQLGSDIDGEAPSDIFGRSVSLSTNGETVAIGARGSDANGINSGHVKIYHWTGTDWSQLGEDIQGEAAGDELSSVALAADAQTVAVGAYSNDGNGTDSGHVRVYRWTGVQWRQLGNDIYGEAPGDRCGSFLAISDNGNILATNSPYNDGNGANSGHVRIYQWTGSSWNQLGEDIDGEAADDLSGFGVSLSSDGSTVAIGAMHNDGNGPSSGHVRVFSWNGSNWHQLGSDIDGEAAGDQSGQFVSMTADGQTVAIGAPYNDGNGDNSGHVRIYQLLPTIDSLSTNTDTISIAVDPVNDPPTLDAISDVTVLEDAPEQLVSLTGITAGGSETQPLRVTATSSNSGLIPNPTVTYASPAATGSIAFTPVADQHGTATITVTVEDGGLDGDLETPEDNATFSQTFEVAVTPVNDLPTAHIALGGDIRPDQSFNGGNTATLPGLFGRPFRLRDGRTVIASTGYAAESDWKTTLDFLLPNGTPDTAVGVNGRVVLDLPGIDFATGVSEQNDGKLLVMGTANYGNASDDWTVTRLHSNGTVDTTFGVSGTFLLDRSSTQGGHGATVRQLPDSSIIAVGALGWGKTLGAVRLTAAGALDTSFGNNGVLEVDLGNIGGPSTGYAQVFPNQDGSFWVSTSNGYQAGIPRDVHLIRVTTAGVVVAHERLRLSNEDARTDTMIRDSLGRFLSVAVTGTDLLLTRHLADGTADQSFGNGGVIQHAGVASELSGVGLSQLPDGRLGVAYLTDSYTTVVLRVIGEDGSFQPLDNGTTQYDWDLGLRVGFDHQWLDIVSDDTGQIIVVTTGLADRATHYFAASHKSATSLSEDSNEQMIGLIGISAGGGESQPLRITATSSDPSLIPNPTVTYASADTTGSLAFTPVADANGTVTITVTVEDGGLDSDLETVADNLSYSHIFDVVVEPVNDAPTLGEVVNLVVEENSPGQLVRLQGITAGGGEGQAVRLLVTSSHRHLISNAFISSLPELGDQSRLLGFAPNPDQYGVTTITVTVEDAGLDGNLDTPEDNATFSRSFDITVTPDADEPPAQPLFVSRMYVHETLSADTLATYRIPAVNINGEPVNGLKARITGVSSEAAIIPDATTLYGATDVASSLSFTPVVGAHGRVTFTINVEDGGPDNDLATVEDNRTATHLAEVTVLEIIADSGSAILSQDPESNVYADTQPITLDEQQAQTDINGFAAIGAESTSAGNAVLVQREGTTYRLVAENTWQIIGMFDSLQNTSSTVLSPVAREPVEFALTVIPGAYVIDSLSTPTLTVHRGQKVIFDLNVTGHPFYLQTTGGGYSSANVYPEGFSGNGQTSGRYEWIVPEDAPDELFYQCEFHAVMFGKIVVVD